MIIASHPDWRTTHHGTTTTVTYIGEGEQTVPEKCKSEAPLPCPFCAEELDPASDGWEHPASDSCPLDSLFILHRHVDGWNTRAASEDAALNRLADERADGPFVRVRLNDINKRCSGGLTGSVDAAATNAAPQSDMGFPISDQHSAAPQEAKPVAWRYRAAPGGNWIIEPRRPNPARCHGNPQPLYTHPAPAPAVPVDQRSFPDAADGRPLPPMGDELMTAGLSAEDARFVAMQLAANGLTLVHAAKPAPQVKALADALIEAEETLALVEHPAVPDPVHHEAVKALGRRIGFGALMSTASAAWREENVRDGYPSGGEFVAGPCLSTVQRALRIARSALSGEAQR